MVEVGLREGLVPSPTPRPMGCMYMPSTDNPTVHAKDNMENSSTAAVMYLSLVSKSSTREFAFVDGGSLTSLCSIISVPDQLKTDFLESTLYAQVNSSLKFDA